MHIKRLLFILPFVILATTFMLFDMLVMPVEAAGQQVSSGCRAFTAVVTNGNDSGAGSLREAILLHDCAGGGIYRTGTLTVQVSQLAHNQVGNNGAMDRGDDSFGSGGAVYVEGSAEPSPHALHTHQASPNQLW